MASVLGKLFGRLMGGGGGADEAAADEPVKRRPVARQMRVQRFEVDGGLLIVPFAAKKGQ